MHKKIFAAVICLACAGGALAGGGGLSKEAYEAMRDRAEATQKAELKACTGAKGNARDICRAEAKGRGRVALAELEAEYHSTPATERGAMMAAADADFAVAKQKCDEFKGRAEDKCRARAEHVHEAAVRQAKIERVQASRRLAAHGKSAPVQQSRDERYAAEKARCGMLGEERDSCLADAKRRFGKG